MCTSARLCKMYYLPTSSHLLLRHPDPLCCVRSPYTYEVQYTQPTAVGGVSQQKAECKHFLTLITSEIFLASEHSVEVLTGPAAHDVVVDTVGSSNK